MRRVLIILCLIFCFCIQSPVGAEYNADVALHNSEDNTQNDETPLLPSIFIWQLPDEEISEEQDELENTEESEITKEVDDYSDYFKNDNDEFITHDSNEENFLTGNDETQLKGYLNYIEDYNAINLNVDNEYSINTRIPKKLKGDKLIKNYSMYPTTTFSQNVYKRTSNLQYNIAPFDSSTEIKKGHFSIGTSYNESIDYSDLGFTTSFYTKYDTKYFSLSTSYDKNSGVAYSQVIDKFTVTPEIKLSKYLSLKNSITSDITRNRTKTELMLLIKPSKEDRVRFELGTNYTFDQNNELIRSQIKFQTQFKL